MGNNLNAMNCYDKLILETAEQELQEEKENMSIIIKAHKSVIDKIDAINDILKKYGKCIGDDLSVKDNGVNDMYCFSIFDYIINVVSDITGVKVSAIKNRHIKSRNRRIVQSRQICYFFLLPIGQNYGVSIQKIALYIAEQDHATAIHGQKTIFNLLEAKNEIELKSNIKDIIEILKKKPYLSSTIRQIEANVNKI